MLLLQFSSFSISLDFLTLDVCKLNNYTKQTVTPNACNTSTSDHESKLRKAVFHLFYVHLPVFLRRVNKDK